MPRRGRVFIVSSKENLQVAYAVQENLTGDAEVTVWDQDAFALSQYALESLLRLLDANDFAVCVCAPTDRTVIKQQTVDVARDNVIFELGLFIGRHGRERCFVVQPNGTELHLPSDFAGIMTGGYAPNRSDGNLRAALGPACNQIRRQIQKQVAEHKDFQEKKSKIRDIAVICYRFRDEDIELLLINTSGGRWVLPKGRRVKVESISEAVARLGRREAGAVGRVDDNPVGTFRYLKNEDNQEQTLTGFLLQVERTELVDQTFRRPTWFTVKNALDALARERDDRYGEEFRTLIGKARSRLAGGDPR
jgi:hypothetical protein